MFVPINAPTTRKPARTSATPIVIFIIASIIKFVPRDLNFCMPCKTPRATATINMPKNIKLNQKTISGSFILRNPAIVLRSKIHAINKTMLIKNIIRVALKNIFRTALKLFFALNSATNFVRVSWTACTGA